MLHPGLPSEDVRKGIGAAPVGRCRTPDAELWLFEQGLRASGVVRTAEKLQAVPWWEIDAARQRLRAAIHERVADPGMAGVLAALSLGDQNAIAHAD